MIRKISMAAVCMALVFGNLSLRAASEREAKLAALKAAREQAGRKPSSSSSSSSSQDDLRGDMREAFGMPTTGTIDIGSRTDVVAQAAQALSDLADRLTMKAPISATAFSGFMSRFAEILENCQARGLNWKDLAYQWDGTMLQAGRRR